MIRVVPRLQGQSCPRHDQNPDHPLLIVVLSDYINNQSLWFGIAPPIVSAAREPAREISAPSSPETCIVCSVRNNSEKVLLRTEPEEQTSVGPTAASHQGELPSKSTCGPRGSSTNSL